MESATDEPHSPTKLHFDLIAIDNGINAVNNTLCFDYTKLGYAYSKP